jgi:hypothetical protein
MAGGMRRETELVGHAGVSGDRERLPKSKIWIYQQRGSELEKPELKFS